MEHRLPEEWNRLTSRIIGCAIEVHSILGPGMLEKMYEDAMCVELGRAGLLFERQKPIPLGLIINFNVVRLVDGITRRLNSRCAQVRSLPPLSPALSPSSVFLPEELQ